MRTYILRRLLLMIPTFFGISLLIFLVLNLAPGRPGKQAESADVVSNARGEATCRGRDGWSPKPRASRHRRGTRSRRLRCCASWPCRGGKPRPPP